MNYKFCKLQQTITYKIVCRSMTLVINIRKYSLNYDAFELSRSHSVLAVCILILAQFQNIIVRKEYKNWNDF